MKIEVILTPAEIARLPHRDLSGTTCVVFDVLRATSTMLTAFSRGARRIFPVSTIEEAHRVRAARSPGALLGGERGGLRLDGFDLGNSPREYAVPIVTGRDIVTTTTNGTLALRACAGAGLLLAGAWLNLDALTAWLAARPTALERLTLICAGTGEDFALEDGLAAGGLIDRLLPEIRASVGLNDAAKMVLALHAEKGGNPLLAFESSANGQRLTEIGLAADVEDCASTTALPWIARSRDGAMEGEFVR